MYFFSYLEPVCTLINLILVLHKYQFSCSIMSDSLSLHGLQRTSLHCHHQLQNLFKLMSIESVMPSNHLILCRPLLHLPSIFPSIRVFSNESALCFMWSKYWTLSFSVNPSKIYSGLISFRIDWFDLLAVQRTLKSLVTKHQVMTPSDKIKIIL